MKRKKVLALAGAAVVVFLTGFSVFYVNQKEDEVIPDFVLTYAENQASDYPTTLGGAYFARLVNERTGGKVEIRIYDNSVLGDEVSVMKQIQYGGSILPECRSRRWRILCRLSIFWKCHIFTGILVICGRCWMEK